MAIKITAEIKTTKAIESVKQLDKALKGVVTTVDDVNKALEKTSKLSGGPFGGGNSSGRSGSSDKNRFRGAGALMGAEFVATVGLLFNRQIKNGIINFALSPIRGKILGEKLNSRFRRAFRRGDDAFEESKGEGDSRNEQTSAFTSTFLADFLPEIAIASIAIGVFVKTLSLASQRLESIGRAYSVGGGSVGDASIVSGLSPIGDFGNIGSNLSHGYGPLVASQAGVNPFGGPFGDNDYNKKTLKVLELIAKQTDFSKARRIAEAVGSPEAANFALLSKISQKQLLDQTNAPGDSGVRARADFVAQITVFKNDFLNLLSNITAPIFQLGSLILKLVNTIDKWGDIVSPFFKTLADALQYFSDFLDKIFGGDEHKQAVQDNTEAINQLNRSINQGIYGGGARAQGAIPKAQQAPGYYQNNGRYTPYGVL